jgi:hypothetical protein
MHYAPYIIVRLSFDQYASIYKLLDAYASRGGLHNSDLNCVVLLDYLYKQADRQFNAFLNRDKRKLYAVKFSMPVALALHKWMGYVPRDTWQQGVRDQLDQILVNYGLVLKKQSTSRN